MARTGRHPRPWEEQRILFPREEFLQARREALENTAMCRHCHPIPPPSPCSCGCCGGCCGGGCRQETEGCCDEILTALEQQNNLLCELLAAVSGLTAACLCHRRET